MIEITDKSKCCGCAACFQACPKTCISMNVDEEGFLYPKVDVSNCINCGLCEKSCPVINKASKLKPLGFYAAINTDESIRLQSSSGGIFSIIANAVINDGGVVFGARFDEKWNVIHSFIQTEKEISLFRGSKYVQSSIGNSYKDAENFLKIGRRVLFSGTPCQIAGLKKYLRKDYENLYTIDFICHGVPSPMVFRRYIKEELDDYNAQSHSSKQSIIKDVKFRDKKEGWRNYSFLLQFEDEDKKKYIISSTRNDSVFLKGFLSNVFLRQSCYSCPSLASHSSSDITLADLWGANSVVPQLFDDKGTSLVVVNTVRGNNMFNSLSGIVFLPIDRKQALNQNPAYAKVCKIPYNRINFFKCLSDNESVKYAINKYAKPSLRERVRSSTIQFIVKLGFKKYIKK